MSHHVRSGFDRKLGRLARWQALLAILVVGVLAVGAGVGAAKTRGKEFRVAVMYPGTQRDGNWGQGWSQGAKDAAKAYGVKISLVENLPDQPDAYIAQGSGFASKGYDMVLIAHGSMGDAAITLAKQFPKTIFCQAPLKPLPAILAKEPDNMCHVDIEQQRSSFLGGVLAGLVTKTNKVGSINGYAFPALTRQPEAFSLGARCVNSKVEFTQKYINSWSDTALGKAAADSMYGSGVDVILTPLIDAQQGVFESAKAHPGARVVPEYTDAEKQAPSVILATVLFDLPVVSKEMIRRALKGSIGPHSQHVFTLGGGLLSPFYNDTAFVGQKNIKILKDIQKKIASGQIKVPGPWPQDKPNIGAPGTAAKIDAKSLGCKPVK